MRPSRYSTASDSSSEYSTRQGTEVTGTTPTGRTSAPTRAFKRAALAALELAQHRDHKALGLQPRDRIGENPRRTVVLATPRKILELL